MLLMAAVLAQQANAQRNLTKVRRRTGGDMLMMSPSGLPQRGEPAAAAAAAPVPGANYGACDGERLLLLRGAAPAVRAAPVAMANPFLKKRAAVKGRRVSGRRRRAADCCVRGLHRLGRPRQQLRHQHARRFLLSEINYALKNRL